MTRRRPGAAGQWLVGLVRQPAVVGLLDQGVSSLTNFVTALVAARLVGPALFGSVSLALVVAYTTVALGRALVGEPLLANIAPQRPQGPDMVPDALGLAVVLGVLSAVVIAAAGLIRLPILDIFPLVAIWLPVMLVQDALRYAAFARLRAEVALASDVAWAAVQFVALAVLLSSGQPGPGAIIATWGAGSAVGALTAMLLLRTHVSTQVASWFRATRSYSMWLLPQLVLVQLTYQASLFVVALAFGEAVLGGLRAMQTVTMPVFILLTAAQAITVPRLTRFLEQDGLPSLRRRVLRWALWVSTGATVLAGVATTFSVLLIRTLFGSPFVPYHDLVLPFAVGGVLHAVALLPGSALRALADAKSLLVVQVSASFLALAAVLATASVGTSYALAWAMASQGGYAAVFSWLAYRRSLASRRRIAADQVRAG